MARWAYIFGGLSLRESSGWDEQYYPVWWRFIYDITCACRERVQQRNNDFCQPFPMGESCLFNPHHEARQLSSSLYVPCTLQAAAPALELRESNPIHRSFKCNAWDSRVLFLTQPQFLWVFIARSYEDISSQPWNSELGFIVWWWNPLFFRRELWSQDILSGF